jgi:hypothetical protein
MTYLFTEAAFDLQEPADVAVVIPTTLRPSLNRALESVYAQDFAGRIHVLVGVDEPRGEIGVPPPPANVALQVFYPGYSTSIRNGGLMAPGDGGALRSVLTLLANSVYVAYLDDDNWWAPEHLRQLHDGLRHGNADWGFSLRWYVHPVSKRPICVDTWESVGPHGGVFRDTFGGFVDPNSLMVNKIACPVVAHCWTMPLAGDPMSADRSVFQYLSANHRGFGSGNATSFYTMSPTDPLHAKRVDWMGMLYEIAG